MFAFGRAPLCDLPTQIDVANNCFWLLLALIFCAPVFRWFGTLAASLPVQAPVGALRVTRNLAILALCTALLAGQSYNPFLYFRF